jgi:hypothetical protein
MREIIYVFEFLSFDIVSNFELRISNFNLLSVYTGPIISHNVCMIG